MPNNNTSFVSVREAGRQLEEVGVKYTRPTLKTTLYDAMNAKAEWKGLIVQTGEKTWIKVNVELFRKWTKETFNVELKETNQNQKKKKQ